MSSTQPGLHCLYRYDPLDRLTNLTRANTPAHQRFYCRSRLATEIQGAIQHSIIQHGDLLLAHQQCDGDDINATLLVTDLQRSVLYILGRNPQRQSIAYSPYGHNHGENGLTSILGFNGERPDPVTGNYLLGNGYRAFNPGLMRFNSPDSLSPFGKGGINAYTYCLGDPINLDDRTGRSPLLYLLYKATELSKHMANLDVWRNGRVLERTPSYRARQLKRIFAPKNPHSLKSLSMRVIKESDVQSYSKTSIAIRDILEAPPFNHNIYNEIKESTIDPFSIAVKAIDTETKKSQLYKVSHFARNSEVMSELKRKTPLITSTTESAIKEMKDIRSNFDELPYDY